MEGRREHPRYALVAPLPRALEVRIEDLFLGLLGTSKPIMGYHITLVGPFMWLAEPDEARLGRVSELCATWPPFAVRLWGLSAFRAANSNAVYIPAHEAEDLIELHRVLGAILDPAIALQRELPEQGYLPHVTLGLGLMDSELERVMADAQERGLDERFMVDEIHLIEERPSAPWRRIRAFPMERPTPSLSAAIQAHER